MMMKPHPVVLDRRRICSAISESFRRMVQGRKTKNRGTSRERELGVVVTSGEIV